MMRNTSPRAAFSHPGPSSLGGELASPYRHPAPEGLPACSVCGAAAFKRCVRCGQPSCLHHARPESLCSTCQSELQARLLRLTRWTAWLGVAATLLGLFAFGGQSIHLKIAWVLLPALFMVPFAIAVARWFSRRRFLRQAAFATWVDGATVFIAPRDPKEELEDLFDSRRGYSHRTRGELPEIPIWQRTYSGL